ncbi:MAG: hypothetical protein J6N51_09090, partial [Selenomonas sp.]|nr:hypothetical protein [Selenomonas sp.]
SHLSSPGDNSAMYVVLTPKQGGARLYSLADRHESPEMAAFMRRPEYAGSGFYAKVPLEDVPQGFYTATLLVVPEQGAVSESAVLAEIEVR